MDATAALEPTLTQSLGLLLVGLLSLLSLAAFVAWRSAAARRQPTAASVSAPAPRLTLVHSVSGSTEEGEEASEDDPPLRPVLRPHLPCPHVRWRRTSGWIHPADSHTTGSSRP
ncbi:MAG: hypothetical protein AAF533_16180 [Acidobacteriota bacterium]